MDSQERKDFTTKTFVAQGYFSSIGFWGNIGFAASDNVVHVLRNMPEMIALNVGSLLFFFFLFFFSLQTDY